MDRQNYDSQDRPRICSCGKNHSFVITIPMLTSGWTTGILGSVVLYYHLLMIWFNCHSIFCPCEITFTLKDNWLFLFRTKIVKFVLLQ